ncbi:MAG: hypothetical protein H6518_09915 [Microthrixaceae bacterium]|nr:hypothetical protein [Microthrixaceae bacterium]
MLPLLALLVASLLVCASSAHALGTTSPSCINSASALVGVSSAEGMPTAGASYAYDGRSTPSLSQRNAAGSLSTAPAEPQTSLAGAKYGYDHPAQPLGTSASSGARFVAPQTTDPGCDLDHIVVGLEAYGLRETAAHVGGRHLLDDPNWRYTFLEALGDRSVRFTTSLDGLDGADPTEQPRTAVHRGANGSPSPTNWEIAQLHQVGRLSTTSLVEDRGRTAVPNPWPASGFPP